VRLIWNHCCVGGCACWGVADGGKRSQGRRLRRPSSTRIHPVSIGRQGRGVRISVEVEGADGEVGVGLLSVFGRELLSDP
jgi:hypothetical protein